MIDEKIRRLREWAIDHGSFTPALLADLIDVLNWAEKLNVVVNAAQKLIYPPRSDYAPGSKKAALRNALEALK